MSTMPLLIRHVRRIETVELGDEHALDQPQAQCPNCGLWGDVDSDQLSLAVSLICPECRWHGFVDGRVA